MAKVRARSDNSLLFLDFYYRGVRCREQTALLNTYENRRRVQSLMKQIVKAIREGTFDYAATFPDSPRAERFASPSQLAVGGQMEAVAAPDPITPSFHEFSILWRGEMAPQWRRLHQRSVDAIFAAHLLPAFGATPLAQITKADVLAFRAKLAAMPGRTSDTMSPATINKVMGILRQCLTEASERFELTDPCRGIKRIKARRPDVQPFTLEEVDRIRTTIRADFRNYVTTRFFTGMRTGEINGLKWKYVDFGNKLILIRETYANGEAEDNAKTESSLRDIPMLPAVEEALRDQFANRHPTSDYVFATRDGNPVDAHNFANRVWYPLLRFLQIDKRRPYQTRHTTATLMLASGENPEWIARLMGHTNTQMLFTVYSRFVPNLTRRDGLAFSGLLSKHAASVEQSEPPAIEDLDLMDADALRAALKGFLEDKSTGETGLRTLGRTPAGVNEGDIKGVSP